MIRVFPLAMGAAMGVMMPFMIHGLGAQALVWFVLAHVAVVAAVAVAALLLARRFGRTPGWLLRHRPSWAHVGQMGAGAVAGFGVLHLWAHGFGGAV